MLLFTDDVEFGVCLPRRECAPLLLFRFGERKDSVLPELGGTYEGIGAPPSVGSSDLRCLAGLFSGWWSLQWLGRAVGWLFIVALWGVQAFFVLAILIYVAVFIGGIATRKKS